jgi:hypothetical protein
MDGICFHFGGAGLLDFPFSRTVFGDVGPGFMVRLRLLRSLGHSTTGPQRKTKMNKDYYVDLQEQ